ncbi:MAG: winged helix-turn-helix transcriptional regulator [Muribaculaceae bacterium]|nr:winged helix-turn-helix transcriptional regulator [Muribaculaceae bacterium]
MPKPTPRIPPSYKEGQKGGRKEGRKRRRINEHENEHINEHIKLSDRQLRIIGYIAENPTITLSELAAKENVAKITIRRNLDVLQKYGIILRQGSARAGRWDISKH